VASFPPGGNLILNVDGWKELSKEMLLCYRETSWGRECRKFKAIAIADQKC